MTPEFNPITSLSMANKAYMVGEDVEAMSGYIKAMFQLPDIAETIFANVLRTRKRYKKNRNSQVPLKVVVCGWELAHNAAGRTVTLFQIYNEISSDVKIIGSIFPLWGTELWEPIREMSIPVHTFVVEADRFIEQALTLVAEHPADVVHLSKPRAPNLLFGIFYKLLWGARVILDIDDEELAFVNAEEPVNITEYLREYTTLPPLNQLTDAHWTRIAVGLVDEFDGITVSNLALQKRYGGIVIGHARDPRMLKPCNELRQMSRQELGIKPHQKVVLFSGTPRPHKGLLEVAQAIQSLRRDDIVFVIVGSFGKNNLKLKLKLEAIKKVNIIFLENQPVTKLHKTLAIADCCVLLQNINSLASRYQIPAKLSDALAMKVPVLSSRTEALEDVIESGAVLMTSSDQLASDLSEVLCSKNEQIVNYGYQYFIDNLTTNTNAIKMQKIISAPYKKASSDGLRKILSNVLESNFNFAIDFKKLEFFNK